LWRIADALQALQKRHFYRLIASLSLGGGSNFYSHENTVDIEVERDDGLDITASDYDELVELCRDLMRWLYKQLGAEYDYANSDENIAELCEANGYEFTIEGALQ